jgi:hypothetical protein
MDKRIASSSNRDALAADIIRDDPEIWPGIGVYTVNEVFWLGGMIQPFLLAIVLH